MKAFLLAAGLGKRLRPYTDAVPKCLIPINGKPLMQIWFSLLETHGITEVLVNTHYHADKVEAFVNRARPGNRLVVKTRYERSLLGSAGTLWHNRDFVAGESDFVIAYGDNLTDVNLTEMTECHHVYRKKGGVLTMGLFEAENPRACGIAVLDKGNRIVDFAEKPRNPAGRLANSGIFIAAAALFDHFPGRSETHRNDEPFDFGFHILPELAGIMYGYRIRSYIRDIGTIASYRAAEKEWPEGIGHI